MRPVPLRAGGSRALAVCRQVLWDGAVPGRRKEEGSAAAAAPALPPVSRGESVPRTPGVPRDGVFCILAPGVVGAWASSRKVGPGSRWAAFLCKVASVGGASSPVWTLGSPGSSSCRATFTFPGVRALPSRESRMHREPLHLFLTQTVHPGRALGRGLRGGSWKSPQPK